VSIQLPGIAELGGKQHPCANVCVCECARERLCASTIFLEELLLLVDTRHEALPRTLAAGGASGDTMLSTARRSVQKHTRPL